VKDISALDLGGSFNSNLFSMILNAGFVVKFVLLLLFVFSVISWAIIFMKYLNYRKIKKEK